MIDEDSAFIEARREFYEEQYRVTEPLDPWHTHAQRIVHSVTREWLSSESEHETLRVLNAGSGGSDYGIKAPMVHLDLVESKIAHLQGYLVGDVTRIPASNSSFDVILCVGSVLNYANPILAIHEFYRVLQPGGLLILEYERSGSAEYRIKYGSSPQCMRVDTFYGSVRTQIWTYSDAFIDGLLEIHGFKRKRELRFHGISSAVLAVTGAPHLASRCVWADRQIAKLWPIRNIASNRMLAVEKFAD